MASTIATYFRSGVQQSGGYVGCVGYDGGPVVGRFQFTTPSTGASTLTFQSAVLTPTGRTTWASGDPDAFRWAVTESATVNMGKIGTDGYSTAVSWGDTNYLTGGTAKSVQLLPNKTYYLWIYPTAANYNLWRINGITVTMGGVYGEKSTFTATNPATFGSACTITLSRNLSSALHTVKVTCLGRTETLLTQGSTYPTLTWTPAVATYAPLLTNAKSTTATITVETFYSGYSVGTTSATIIVNFADADVKPSVTMAVSDPTGYAATYGAFVATKSKIQVALTASYQYGASFGSAAITANGQSYSTNPATTDEIASAANTAVSGRIIDSRGVSSDTASTTLTVLAYTPPQISSFSIHRCNQDGTANEQGAYMRVDYSVEITALNNVNSKALAIKYKKRVDESYTTQAVTLSSYTQTGSVVIAADTNSTYDVEAVLTDDFSTASSILQLSTAFATVNFRAGGDGVAIGKVSEFQKVLQLASGWTIMVDEEDIVQVLNDLGEEVHTSYATIEDLPTKTSELANDAGYSIISYVDDPSAANITVGSGHYQRINPPSGAIPTGSKIFAVTAVTWASNSGPFSIMPCALASGQEAHLAYVVADSGTTINGFKARWWFLRTKQVTSLSVVFDPGDNVIYDSASLDDLRPYLTVTVNYDDNTTEVTTAYSLSGSLTAGTQTITVSYASASATFTVTVVADAYPISNVQSYFRSSTESVASEINGLSSDWESFVFITDPHGSGNQQHSQAIALWLLNHTPATMLVLGGDYSKGNWSSSEYNTYMAPFLNSGLVSKIYPLCGNHEAMGGNISAAKAAIYDDFLDTKTNIAGEPEEIYYYFDDTAKKTRYLFINTSDSGQQYVMTAEQIAWIEANVVLPAIDWQLLIFGHVTLAQMAGVTYSNETNGADILAAIANCNGSIVGYFCGHQHIDYTQKIGNIQHTTFLCDKLENTNYYDGISLTNRVAGTVSEQAVTVVSFNRSTKDVVTRRIGAGRQRSMTYSYPAQS